MKHDLIARIRFVKDEKTGDEWFYFENKHKKDQHWGLESAFRLLNYDHDGYHEDKVLINYQALTTIRQWQLLGMPFHFGGDDDE